MTTTGGVRAYELKTEGSAKKINDLHRDLCGIGKTALEKAIEIGQLLSSQKASMQHGEWLPWIENNLKFNRNTAANYIRVYDNRAELKCTSVVHLTDAYARLANSVEKKAPSSRNGSQKATPAAARDDDRSWEIDPDEPGDSDQVIWRRGVWNRAQESIGHAMYEDWSKFKSDPELVNAATQASEAWKKLAAYLKELL